MFELCEYDGYEVAPRSGWLSPIHRTEFHEFIREKVVNRSRYREFI